MDQSTQVNFPISTRMYQMKRHNTSADISTNKAWNGSRPTALPRPKSVNGHVDVAEPGIPKFKAHFKVENSCTRLNQQDVGYAQLSREKTSTYSSDSSIIMNTQNYPSVKPYIPPRLKHHMADDESSASSCKCYNSCYDVEKGILKIVRTSTPEGLSWRRLHMSRAKLKATATTSELLSGFAMVAMVELQINEPTNVPQWLFIVFAVCTTILVSVHIFALMISTYILPNIDAIAKLEVCEMVGESPHERMRGFIELAWAFSTVLGLFLFLVEVAILCWVKFWDYSFPAAIGASVVIIPVLFIFVLFAVHFYHSVVVFKCDSSMYDMEKLENMKKQLDEVACSV